MGYNIGQIMTVTFRSRLFNQRILNVAHVRVKTVSSLTAPGELQALASYLADSSILLSPLNLWKPIAAINFTFDEVRVQPISPASAAYKVAQINENGTNANGCTASNIAISVSLRGDAPTHHNAGRKQLAGIPDSTYNNGIFTGSYLAMVNAWATSMVGPFVVPTGMGEYVWCLADRAVPANYIDLTDYAPQPQVRTMHRRTVGLGE